MTLDDSAPFGFAHFRCSGLASPIRPADAPHAMAAMLKMKKLDVGALKRAAEGRAGAAV
jgi:hypothetical protein